MRAALVAALVLGPALVVAARHDAVAAADDGVDLTADPAPCLARYPGTVEDPDWKRFATVRVDVAAGARAEVYLERAAAICIARAAGLGAGDVPWTARLLYRVDERDVVWIVTRSRRARNGGGVHRELTLDAVSGRVLGSAAYATRPRALNGGASGTR